MLYCVGNSYAENSFLVRCDCYSHIIEIGYILHPEEQDTRCGYVEFLSPLYTKYKFPDVYFNDEKVFISFLKTLKDMSLAYTLRKTKIFYSYGVVQDTKQILGRLELDVDNHGYLNMRYYKNQIPKKREKVVWDICLHGLCRRELYNKCNEMLTQIQNKTSESEN